MIPQYSQDAVVSSKQPLEQSTNGNEATVTAKIAMLEQLVNKQSRRIRQLESELYLISSHIRRSQS